MQSQSLKRNKRKNEIEKKKGQVMKENIGKELQKSRASTP